MPKLFLIIGSILAFIGALFLILSSQPSLGFHKTTAGAIAFGFGAVFIIIASIGMYVRRTLKSLPDVGHEYKTRHGPGSKYVVDDPEEGEEGGEQETTFTNIPTVSGRPQSAGPVANGHAGSRQRSSSQPNSQQNGRPSSAPPPVDPRTARLKSAGTRPSSAPGKRSSPSTPGQSLSPQPDHTPSSSPYKSKQNDKTVNKSTKSKLEPIRTNSLAASPISEENEEDEAKPPFYTGASGQLADSPAQIHTAVVVHAPPKKPLPPIGLMASFSNDGYEGEEVEPEAGAAVPGLHPYLMETPEELVARISPRPSPMMNRRAASPRPAPASRDNSCEEIDTQDDLSVSSFQ